MTLAAVPRYKDIPTSTIGEHAVVIGAGMAGLLAGRVLTDWFQTVSIIDRDPLPDKPVTRRGVPQANHVHVLLEAGRVTLEDLFPESSKEILSSGGVLTDAASDLNHYQKGDFLADGSEHLPLYCASRPLFEQVVRKRLAECADVTIRPECQYIDYIVDAATTIKGAVILDKDGAEIRVPADLVVDATGRTSQTPHWLAQHPQYVPPDINEVTVDLDYSTTVIERPSDRHQAFLIAPSPPIARGGAAIPIENDRWIVTLFGLHGETPPTDVHEFKEFARNLPTSELYTLLDTQQWVSEEIHHYPFPSNLRRHYETLNRFPDGLIVTGDAIASFNPIYGQGMSVASLTALQLHQTLATSGQSDLALRFFDRAAKTIDVVWNITVGSDFEFSQTEGEKPRGTDLFNRYLSRLIRTAHVDAHVSDQFSRVLRLEKSPTILLTPDVLWRVLDPTRGTPP